VEIILLDFGDVTREAMRLREGAKAAITTQYVMDKILADMYRIEGEIFKSQGRRGGGSWKGLSDITIKRKGMTDKLITIGMAEGYNASGQDLLRKSVTDPTAEYSVGHATKTTISFGTSRPYGFVHQFGSTKRRVPPRPFIKFTGRDIDRWRQMIYDHLLRPHTVK